VYSSLAENIKILERSKEILLISFSRIRILHQLFFSLNLFFVFGGDFLSLKLVKSNLYVIKFNKKLKKFYLQSFAKKKEI